MRPVLPALKIWSLLYSWTISSKLWMNYLAVPVSTNSCLHTNHLHTLFWKCEHFCLGIVPCRRIWPFLVDNIGISDTIYHMFRACQEGWISPLDDFVADSCAPLPPICSFWHMIITISTCFRVGSTSRWLIITNFCSRLRWHHWFCTQTTGFDVFLGLHEQFCANDLTACHEIFLAFFNTIVLFSCLLLSSGWLLLSLLLCLLCNCRMNISFFETTSFKSGG